jgi:hypothetical protein
MLNQYEENVNKVQTLFTRNKEEAKTVESTTFWLTDVKQEDGSMKLTIAISSFPSALKFSQNHSENCFVVPVDNGVFNERGLPISNKELFIYKWENDEGILEKFAGDCDALIVKNKWCFIEFKTEMLEGAGNDLTKIARNITNNKRKGYAQLAKSVFSFIEQLDNFEIKGTCILALPNFMSYPKYKASDIAMTSKYEKLLKNKFVFEKITVGGNINFPIE